MNSTPVHQRIVRATAATLQVTLTDQDGEPEDAAGAVTVAVATADGAEVLAAGTATSAGAGVYTVTLTAAQTVDLNLLTATWSTGGNVVASTLHEIVGGVYFSVAQARAADAAITASAYDNATVQAARAEVEQQCEAICGVAWVPRYQRATLTANGGHLVLPTPMVRRIRTVNDVDTSTGVLTPWASTDVTPISVGRSGVISSARGFGSGTVVVEWEHGYDRPPADLVKASILHLRHQLNTFVTSSLIDRATQVQTIEGQNMQLATPGRFGFDTGIPVVDAVYQRYSHKIPGVA
jgi:hypothetical protein